MNPSTSTRLTVVAVVAVLALMPLAGWLIAGAYEKSALASFDSRLEAYAGALAGQIDVDAGGELVLPARPLDLRFDQVFSGWYWQVQQGERILGTSRSLWDSSLQRPMPRAQQPVVRALRLQGPRAEPLRGIGLQLQLRRMPEAISLTVTLPESEVDLEVAAFQRLLASALGLLGVMLVLVFGLQIRWGLKPLRRMERSLHEVRSGSSARVAPDLPGDLRQVATVMNEVLEYQEKLIERGRSTAGNLAHALKTPLATLRLHVESGAVERDASLQCLDQVQEIVEHHLARASAAGRATGLYHRSNLRDAAQPVLTAVRALNRDRAIAIHAHFDGNDEVLIDAQDLQELLGNLLENASRYARTRVALKTTTLADHIRVQIDDDGPGIPSEARARVLARGTQLDEGSHGSGLGLAIVRDIATLYRIELDLTHNEEGGLRVVLDLPRSVA